MSVHGDHYIVKCTKCKTVISQCRCPASTKPVTWEFCGKCDQHEGATNCPQCAASYRHGEVCECGWSEPERMITDKELAELDECGWSEKPTSGEVLWKATAENRLARIIALQKENADMEGKLLAAQLLAAALKKDHGLIREQKHQLEIVNEVLRRKLLSSEQTF